MCGRMPTPPVRPSNPLRYEPDASNAQGVARTAARSFGRAGTPPAAPLLVTLGTAAGDDTIDGGARHCAVVLVDTQQSLSPVCAAALSSGAKSVWICAKGSAIVDLLMTAADDDATATTQASRAAAAAAAAALLAERSVAGGVAFETVAERKIARIRAEAQEAQEQLDELLAGAQKQRAFNAIAANENMDVGDDPIARQTAGWIAQVCNALLVFKNIS